MCVGTALRLARAAAVCGLLAAAAYGGAIEDIKANIAADPDNPDLYFDLALEYEGIKDWRQAADAYLMAIALDPGDADLHFRLAEVYLADEEVMSAIDSYRKALSLEPELSRAHYQLGRCYLGLREYDNAIAAFEKYVEASPYDFDGLWYLGQSLEKAGRKREALDYYKKILDYSTGAFASAGEIGVFGTSDDIAAYIRKLEKEIYGE
jgi:tetratricopeptide (TPR) repeat protein